MAFTVTKATGNLINLSAIKIRNGDDSPAIRDEISALIAKLKSPEHWSVVENQVNIIDRIAFAAATIGDWTTAAQEAERNIENYTSLATNGGLSEEDKVNLARAREIRHFSRLFLDGPAATVKKNVL